ncbi:MAG: hypothetical protein KC620_12345 [Myxococcales bacterium]|nr:hypothetical protein [Myxococcales bacterium]
MWTLELPPQTRGGGTLTTAAVEARPRSLATLRLMRVAVSRDEETIEVAFRFGDGDLAMPQRAHHALLRVLAQARLNDAGAPPAERGWMYADDLCRATGINAERLYVEVYRARKQLAALGVGDAAGLFERRSQSRQIRLGVGRVEVTALR